MEERRILIPKELRQESNLKGVNKIIITLKDNEILLMPFQEDYKELKVLGIRALDHKGRFLMPRTIHMELKNLVPVLYQGKIWIKRCVL